VELMAYSVAVTDFIPFINPCAIFTLSALSRHSSPARIFSKS